MKAPFRIIPFDTKFDRTDFRSTSEALNHYLQAQASQDIKRRVASCFLALTSTQKIAGYYTLASTSIPLNALPDELRKKLPRYHSIPAVLMGRLAVDQNLSGQGLGSALLIDAIQRILRSEIATYALVVEAKDENAIRFYQKFGFIVFSDTPNKLFYPLNRFKALP
ncbi:GCN5 family acetyltransferase [Pasteurellaceae bacterium Orientalotternb1]|nr:GCN5 family acetyltransferase [Pasteurellaceae bacterium Orientalotternb1]